MVASKVRPEPGGTVNEALVGSAGALNPLFEQEDNARDIDRLIYQGLTTINPQQQPAPLLASSWAVSPDHLSYSFALRKGIRWADGASFSADDVLFTFAVLQDPSYEQPLAPFWRDLKVARLDALHVRFTLRAPSASFLVALRIGIIARHLFPNPRPDSVAADPHSSNEALGTGPFRVDSISNDRQLIKLRRNSYANPAPHLDGFTFHSFPTLAQAEQAFSSGLVDAVGGVQPADERLVSPRADARILDQKTFSFVAVLLNVSPDTTATLDPAQVRQALNEAIDRKGIVRQILGGAADVDGGPIPPSDWAFSAPATNKYGYDPSAARRLLDASGWTLPPGGKIRVRKGRPFAVSIYAVDAYPYGQVARAVSAQLAQVGVSATVQSVPAALLVEKYLMGRHYQLLLAAFDNGPDPDQYSLWHSDPRAVTLSFVKLPGQALIDKDLEDGRTAYNLEERVAIYRDLQSLLLDAAPAIFLYEPHYLYVVSSRIKGLHMNPVIDPSDRFQYVTDWFVPGQAL